MSGDARHCQAIRRLGELGLKGEPVFHRPHQRHSCPGNFSEGAYL